MIITIDGPVASGKSTVAKEIAKLLNIYYLNTGLLYRAVAYLLSQRSATDGVDIKNMQIHQQDLEFVGGIEYVYVNNKPQILFNGQDITKNLVVSNIDQAASVISANKSVRAALLDLQRKIATEHGVVADGRDCGSIVFPMAEFKFFLTASLDERAARMLADKSRNIEKTIDLQAIKKQIEERDKRDTEREVAPLKVPAGSVIIDSTAMTFDAVVQKVLDIVKKGDVAHSLRNGLVC